jgi:hypothetical protein
LPAKKKVADITKIAVSSKLTVPIGSGWFSFSADREKTFAVAVTKEEADKAQVDLFDDVNKLVDCQQAEALEMYETAKEAKKKANGIK